MRNPLVAVMLSLVVAATEVHAQAPAAAPATTPAPVPATTPPATTTIHGTPPDLQGRWLVLFEMHLNDRRRTMVSVVEIGVKNGRPDVVEHFVDLPAEPNTQLEENNQKGVGWTPTPEQLATIARQWTELPDGGRGVTQVANDLWGKDGFDDTIAKEPDLEGSQWVLRQTYSFAPGGQRPARQINVYGAKAAEGAGWRGFGIVAQVVVAPFPIPISFKGEFRMIRVGDVAGPPGPLARLLDALKGCGR